VRADQAERRQLAKNDFGDSRPMLKVGEWPDITVDQARALTKTVRALAEKGIDVQEGLHAPLLGLFAEHQSGLP
jgi:hypothetical protein